MTASQRTGTLWSNAVAPLSAAATRLRTPSQPMTTAPSITVPSSQVMSFIAGWRSCHQVRQRATVGACQPVACAAGRIGAPCQGLEDDRACDSAPDAMDGWCDACRISGGESTENEMFLLLGQYYIDEGFPQRPVDGPVFAGPAGLPR